MGKKKKISKRFVTLLQIVDVEIIGILECNQQLRRNETAYLYLEQKKNI